MAAPMHAVITPSSSVLTMAARVAPYSKNVKVKLPSVRLSRVSGCAHARAKAALASTPYGMKIELRSEEHTSELQSQSNLVCRLLLEKKTINQVTPHPRGIWGDGGRSSQYQDTIPSFV